MALRLREPYATDFLEAIDPAGRLALRNRRMFMLMAHQVDASEAATLVDEAGAVLAVIGLYESPDGEVEVWLTTTARLAGRLVPALRLMERALRHVGALVPGLVVTAYIDPRSVAGDRLARLLRFTDTGITEIAIGPVRTWRRSL